MRLHATKQQVNGHAWVNVSDDPEEASHQLWRERGYAPREEGGEGEAGELDSMTVKELEALVESEGLDVDLSDYRLKAEKVAAVEEALAAREAE